MDRLDVRGLSCPIPVVKTKQLVDQGITSFVVIGDSSVSRENISRFVQSQGYTLKFVKDDKNNWEMDVSK